MLQGVVCWGKSKIGECNHFTIDNKSEDIKVAKLCLSNISDLQSKLDRCIEKNEIEDVLRFQGDYIEDYYWDKIREKELHRKITNGEDLYPRVISSCKLKPDVCRIVSESKVNVVEKLMNEIDDRVKKYNNELAIIKQVQNYCLNYTDYRDYKNKDVYFKFGRDKNDDLIALYFNIKSFVDNNEYSPVQTVYVFSGDSDYPFHKHTMLHLKYEEYSALLLSGTEAYDKLKTMKDKGYQAHICDFISNNKRKGHGTFILKHLEDIIKEVNKKIAILQEKDKERYLRREPIIAVNGEVCPGDIPYEALVKLYNKNGFPTIGKMYSKGGYAKDRIIYKELG